MLFQKVRVAIFLLKHEIDLLSLIYCGMEFQIEAPSTSYIKLFRLHIVRIFGFGKRIELELSRRLWFNISVLKVKNSLTERIWSHVNVIIERFKHKFCFGFYSLLFERFPS
jgi:hypothetical protein